MWGGGGSVFCLAAVVAPAQQDAEILILGGEVVTADGRRRADVRVVGETIAEVGTALTARDANTQEIDARGLLVLPGGIDPHVHLGGSRVDDYTSGSAAALAGGITTISNFGGVAAGEAATAAVERAAALVRTQSIADVIFHPIIFDPATATADTLAALAASGHTSIKIFMVQPSFDQNVPGFIATMHAAREAGVLVMMHCEDAAIIQTTAARFIPFRPSCGTSVRRPSARAIDCRSSHRVGGSLFARRSLARLCLGRIGSRRDLCATVSGRWLGARADLGCGRPTAPMEWRRQRNLVFHGRGSDAGSPIVRLRGTS